MGKIENLLDTVQVIMVFILKLVIICMVITQVLMLIPGMGARFNIALRLEGAPLDKDINFDLYQAGNISLTPWTSITLELQDYHSRPDVIIELNGRDVGTFIKKDFSLAVKQGDIITIINPKENYPVKIIVSKKTSNIRSPNTNSVVIGAGRLFFDAVDLE